MKISWWIVSVNRTQVNSCFHEKKQSVTLKDTRIIYETVEPKHETKTDAHRYV